MIFVKNMLLEWQSKDGPTRVDRIVYLDPAAKQMTTICVTSSRELWLRRTYVEIETAMVAGDVRILAEDPYIRLDGPEEELSHKQRQLRDSAWAAIRHLFENGASTIFDPRQRGQLIAEAAQRARTTKKVLYKYLRRYLQGGLRKNALLPRFDQCGAPGREKACTPRKRGRPSKLAWSENRVIGINVDGDVREKFRRGYKKYYLQQNGPTLREVFQRTLEDFFRSEYEVQKGVLRRTLPPPEKRPTYWQFRYWVNKERTLSTELIKRCGEPFYNAKHRPLIGNPAKMAIGPGFLYMIDATVTDYYLVNALDPCRLLGRAVFYRVVDVFSWTIAGIDVGLHNASVLGAMLALYNAARDKVAFCAEHGIEISECEWPHKFLSEGILADRGELMSMYSDNLAQGLDLPVSNTPPYRGDLKYLVEQDFRRMNQRLLSLIPSAIQAKRQRGKRDPRLDACLTLRDARQIAILDALDHNKNYRLNTKWMNEYMIEDHVERYPLDVWNWGLTYRTGCLRVMPDDLIRANLLPEATATVTGKGIRFDNMYYTCPTAEAEEWFVKARVRGSWGLSVVHDPRLPDVIYLRLQNGRRLERCQRLERDDKFVGHDLAEINDFFEGQQILDQAAESRSQDTTAELHDRVREITEPAQARSKAARAGMSASTVLKNIRENKDEARKEEQQATAWSFSDDSITANEVQNDQPAAEEWGGEPLVTPNAFVHAIDLLDQIN